MRGLPQPRRPACPGPPPASHARTPAWPGEAVAAALLPRTPTPQPPQQGSPPAARMPSSSRRPRRPRREEGPSPSRARQPQGASARASRGVSKGSACGRAPPKFAPATRELLGRGISVRQLLEFYAHHEQAGTIAGSTTTGEVVERILRPALAGGSARCFMEAEFMVARGGGRRASRLVGHAMASTFLSTVLNVLLDATGWSSDDLVKNAFGIFAHEGGLRRARLLGLPIRASALLGALDEPVLGRAYWICAFADDLRRDRTPLGGEGELEELLAHGGGSRTRRRSSSPWTGAWGRWGSPGSPRRSCRPSGLAPRCCSGPPSGSRAEPRPARSARRRARGARRGSGLRELVARGGRQPRGGRGRRLLT
ncbi:unnamed protein product, partial [Prorocentrum cordatum]